MKSKNGPHSKRATFPPLTFTVKGELFSQLGAMEKAGLPIATALDLIRLPSSLRSRVSLMRRSIRSGEGVAESGKKSGLFSSLEASLLQAAFDAGNPERSYRRLSAYYARRVARTAAMKSRMMLPMAMLVIGIFVQPLPRLVAGTLSSTSYLLKCLLQLSALGAATYLWIEWPSLQSSSAAPSNAWLARSSQRIPLFGAMNVRRNARDFFESLALLVEAGMPILQALPIASDTIQDSEIRRQFLQIKPWIEQGASFAEALNELSFVGRPVAHALISTGEASGALPEMLFHYAQRETAAIDRFDGMIAEWLPRIFYTLAALAIGYSVVRSGAFLPSLPSELR